jgi:hypothetical protein
MRYVSRLSAVLVLATGFATAADSAGLRGLWTLHIRNLDHLEVSLATIRFTDDAAPSCIGGNWKRVAVESISATDNKFFPLSDPLSYTVEGPDLIIGRNELCDAYLRLRGKLVGGNVSGSYYLFSISGGRDLGDFTLDRKP